MISNSRCFDKPLVIQRLEWALLCFGLVVALALAFKLRLPDFDWQIAMSGWSAIDWVAHLRFPDRYQFDFPNGINLYGKSTLMYVYLFLNEAFDIPVETIIPAMIFLEMFFLVGASIFFARSLNGANSPVGAFVFALLVVVSPARDLDLSFFGAPFFWGLSYNFADGLRLLGVAFFLRRQPLLSGVLLGIGFSIHPIIALMGCAFLTGFVAFQRNWIGFRELLLGALVFLVIAAAWLAYSYDFTSIVSTQVDPLDWIRMARAFSYHFFPIDYGLLTLDFQKRVLPLLVLCLLALHYLSVVCEDRSLRRGVVGGCLVLVGLIAAGLIISVQFPIPALIKLALPRASAMLILVTLAIACLGLARDIESGTILLRLLAGLIVVSPFVSPPGFPLIPVTLLILFARRGLEQEFVSSNRPREFVALALVWAIAFANEGARYGELHGMPAYTGYFPQFNYWRAVGFMALLLLVLSVFARWRGATALANKPKMVIASSLGPVIVFLAACYLAVTWQRAHVPSQAYRALGVSYLDAQRWARTNSPEQAIFLVDPSIYYGWRDYSQRSSFGNLREWLHTSWLYDSRADRYQEGLQRFGEFGIPLDPYLALPVSHLLGSQKLTADIQRRFYEVDEKWFLAIRERYRVSHVVMRKDSLVRDYPFAKVFENGHFVIFDLARTTDKAVLRE